MRRSVAVVVIRRLRLPSSAMALQVLSTRHGGINNARHVDALLWPGFLRRAGAASGYRRGGRSGAGGLSGVPDCVLGRVLGCVLGRGCEIE